MSLSEKNAPYILDCTFRDGGYYNEWDFNEDLVEKYLRLLALSGVDIIEIGYRFFKSKDYCGPFGFCSEEFLGGLNIDPKISVAVMVNASEVLTSNEDLDRFKASFISAKKSRVDIVRLATYMADAGDTEHLVEYLKSQGYKVCINLMKISESSESDIEDTVKQMNQWKIPADVIYIADSFGNLDTEKTGKLIELTSKFWNGEIGFHAHNNQGKALTNTIAAMKKSATWLDSTILGMGRGAGNASTESLMMELNQENGDERYDSKAIFPLVVEEFQSLRSEHGWGHSLLYEVSSRYSVHPTYIQEILYKKDKYSTDQILRSLEKLTTTDSTSYTAEIAESLLVSDEIVKGDWNATGYAKDRDILILGAGPEGRRNSDQIEQFIQRKNTLTLSLNVNRSISEELIDAYVIVNRVRFLTELNKKINKEKDIILPLHILSEDMKESLNLNQILNYGCNISSGLMEASKSHCVIPFELAIAYALSISIAGNASKIYLAGFDGFEIYDPRQDEMLEVFRLFKSISSIPIISITKTNYPLEKRTIHDPSI